MDPSVEEYFAVVGTVIDLADLQLPAARGSVQACQLHSRFRLLEARVTDADGRRVEVLVVECESDAIPTYAPVDIRYRERLALRFTDEQVVPSVLALRRSFPSVPHLNQMPPGLPRSLCLYFEPWEATRITWTPRRHLDRILWWLSQTAVGQLHRGDQPLERLYFPFQHQLFLNEEFNSLQQRPGLQFGIVALSATDAPRRRFLGRFQEPGKPRDGTAVSFLAVEVEDVVHGAHEAYPTTLGELADQLGARGRQFLDGLEAQVREKTNGQPLALSTEQSLGLLFVNLSMRRSEQGAIERKDLLAFLFEGGIGKLGVALGWLTRDPARGFLYTPTLLETGPQSQEWRALAIEPIEVVESVSPQRIRAIAGLQPTAGEFAGVLAGAGALGSALLNLWARQAWGTWAVFDGDCIRPHNPIRHEARGDAIGFDKVAVVRELANSTHAARLAITDVVPKPLKDFSQDTAARALAQASLVVDATTTLDLPRDLSRQDGVPRSSSVFFTPRATGSVLMIEDDKRALRLDQIEPQYYRAILRSAWGGSHLEGNLGQFWVGAGCRDISASISPEAVQLQSSLLSQSLRDAQGRAAASVRIWETNRETGAIERVDLVLHESWREERGGWTVLFDAGLLETARAIRQNHLPAETGGILLGSIDQYRRTIALVDVMPPPADSIGTAASFERGTRGVPEAVREASRRTAGIVGYVGEWHSHPPRSSTNMSGDDLRQILHLTMHLGTDGDPCVMLIVGDAECSLYVGEVLN